MIRPPVRSLIGSISQRGARHDLFLAQRRRDIAPAPTTALVTKPGEICGLNGVVPFLELRVHRHYVIDPVDVSDGVPNELPDGFDRVGLIANIHDLSLEGENQ